MNKSIKETTEDKSVQNFFKIKAYATELNHLNLALGQIQKLKPKVSQLRQRIKTHLKTIPKNPHGKGYKVYVKLEHKIHRVLITGPGFKNYRACKKILKNFGIYVVSQIS